MQLGVWSQVSSLEKLRDTEQTLHPGLLRIQT